MKANIKEHRLFLYAFAECRGDALFHSFNNQTLFKIFGAFLFCHHNLHKHPRMQCAEGGIRAFARGRSPHQRLGGVCGQREIGNVCRLAKEVVRHRVIVGDDEAHG